METCGLMPHNDGRETSRDFELPVIPCKVVGCPANNGSHCVMPSMIDIGDDGRCKNFDKYIKHPTLEIEKDGQ